MHTHSPFLNVFLFFGLLGLLRCRRLCHFIMDNHSILLYCRINYYYVFSFNGKINHLLNDGQSISDFEKQMEYLLKVFIKYGVYVLK